MHLPRSRPGGKTIHVLGRGNEGRCYNLSGESGCFDITKKKKDWLACSVCPRLIGALLWQHFTQLIDLDGASWERKMLDLIPHLPSHSLDVIVISIANTLTASKLCPNRCRSYRDALVIDFGIHPLRAYESYAYAYALINPNASPSARGAPRPRLGLLN